MEAKVLETAENSGVQHEEPAKRAGFLRVKVVDTTKEGRPAVNIRVPIVWVKWGMKIAQASSPEVKAGNLDWVSIAAMIQEGEQGKIVDVEDEAQHKTIEVWVE